jgi:hypothetical protein
MNKRMPQGMRSRSKGTISRRAVRERGKQNNAEMSRAEKRSARVVQRNMISSEMIKAAEYRNITQVKLCSQSYI